MNKTIIIGSVIAISTFLSCGKEKEITEPKPPYANAGNSITAVAGCNKIQLEGFFLNYSPSMPNLFWKQVSGPTASVIVDPNKITTLVTNVGNGTYRYVLQVTDEIGTATDTVNVNIVNAKEITLPTLLWNNLVDDIFHVWGISVKRPDLFCDTLRVKQIEVNGANAEPLWTVGTFQSLMEGSSKAGIESGGYFYKYNTPDMLEVFVNGGIRNRETSIHVTFK